MKKKKKIIVLKGGAEIFDCNYLVLECVNRGKKNENNLTRDMVCEANRVIEEKIECDKKRRLTQTLLFIVFFLSGALISAIFTFCMIFVLI